MSISMSSSTSGDTNTEVKLVWRRLSELNGDLREGAAFVAGWHQSRVGPEWNKAKKRWKRLEKTGAFWRD